MIRKAVGAIVTCENKFMLVQKVKINSKLGTHEIEAEWDFLKGGVKEEDIDLKQSLLRELEEETGETNYRIIKQFKEQVLFEFPPSIKNVTGFENQVTTMFHVEYLGCCNELVAHDEEINEIRFVDIKHVLDYLKHEETKEFFKKYFY